MGRIFFSALAFLVAFCLVFFCKPAQELFEAIWEEHKGWFALLAANVVFLAGINNFAPWALNGARVLCLLVDMGTFLWMVALEGYP